MIREDINHLIADAMKSKEADRLYVLKMIKAKFLELKTSKGFKEEDFTDAKEISILQKMEKTWQEEYEMLKQLGRDRQHELKAQIDILHSFIPAEPSADDILQCIKESGFALEMKNMRNILAFVQAKYPTASGKQVSDIIRNS